MITREDVIVLGYYAEYKHFQNPIMGSLRISMYNLILTKDYHLSPDNAIIIHHREFLNDLIEITPKQTEKHLLLTHLDIFIKTIEKEYRKEFYNNGFYNFSGKITPEFSKKLTKKLIKLQDQGNVFVEKMFYKVNELDLHMMYSVLVRLIHINFSKSLDDYY